jgi:hypothetical protein
MSNVIDLKAARAARAMREAEKLADVFDANQDAELRAALAAGFEFKHVGEDRWGDRVFSVSHRGVMIVDGRAELSVADGLCLVRELLDSGLPPSQYRKHAARFIAVVADLHSEADAAIEADR